MDTISFVFQNGLFARMWQEYQASVQWKVAKEGKE